MTRELPTSLERYLSESADPLTMSDPESKMN